MPSVHFGQTIALPPVEGEFPEVFNELANLSKVLKFACCDYARMAFWGISEAEKALNGGFAIISKVAVRPERDKNEKKILSAVLFLSGSALKATESEGPGLRERGNRIQGNYHPPLWDKAVTAAGSAGRCCQGYGYRDRRF